LSEFEGLIFEHLLISVGLFKLHHCQLNLVVTVLPDLCVFKALLKALLSGSVQLCSEALRLLLLLDLSLILLQRKLKINIFQLTSQIFIQSLNLDAMLDCKLFLDLENFSLVAKELLTSLFLLLVYALLVDLILLLLLTFFLSDLKGILGSLLVNLLLNFHLVDRSLLAHIFAILCLKILEERL